MGNTRLMASNMCVFDRIFPRELAHGVLVDQATETSLADPQGVFRFREHPSLFFDICAVSRLLCVDFFSSFDLLYDFLIVYL